MKIGIVCQNYPPATFEGGVSHYSRLLAEHLLPGGNEVCALTSTEFAKPSESPSDAEGVEIVEIRGPWNHLSVFEIRRKIKERRLDAVVLQYSPASFARSFRITWALTRFPCKKITAFHTLWGAGLDRLVGLLMLLGNDATIATNSEIMFLLEKYLPCFLKKTCWIPIGSNIAPQPAPTDSTVGPEPLLSYFGMLYRGKGLDIILAVLAELKSRGHSFRFKFIGGGMLDHDDYEEAFQRKIERSGLKGSVEHLGVLPEQEVSYWLNKSRFVFLPYDGGLSDRRGTLMAALVHGKAVLTSPPAVAMAFVKNGHNLLWPTDTSVTGYADLFEALLADDSMVARLEEGARRLSRHFSWDRIAFEHERVFTSRLRKKDDQGID